MIMARGWGSLRKLPSGRWQAGARDRHGTLRPAPTTFATKKAAANALAKPIIVGEINDGLSHFADARARASSVTTSMRQYLAAGAGAALVWNYTFTDGSYDADYSIVPTDPMVAAVAGMGALRR
jgi:hypothetical protein